MKKIISAILCVLLILSTCSVTLAKNDNVKVVVNGKTLYSDVAPQIINNRTMVPLRAIFEALGATVKWDDATKSITASKKNVIVDCAIDSHVLSVNGVDKQLDVTPMIINNRTLVPARFAAEAFGCNVEWDGTQKIVTITSPSTYYPKSDIPSFTGETGVPVDSSSGDVKKMMYNTYELISANAIQEYIDALKDAGWTSAYVKNEGDLIIEAYRSGKNLVEIMITFNQEYRILDGTITIAYTTNSPLGTASCITCAQNGQDLCQGHTCSVCNGNGSLRCNGCHGTGYHKNPLNIYDNKCTVCYGMGTQICPNCDGGRKIFYK